MARYLAKGALMTDTDRNMQDAKNAAQDAAKRVGDTAQDTAADTARTMGAGADRIGDAARDTAADTAQTLRTGAGRIGDTADDAIRDLRGPANETVDAITAQAQAAMSGAKETVDEGVAYVKARYRENPGVVIAVGAAAAVALGLVVRAISRR
jgi:ElaB/YqjD/DUF883 family membrane-anchored ribosome-binding protein